MRARTHRATAELLGALAAWGAILLAAVPCAAEGSGSPKSASTATASAAPQGLAGTSTTTLTDQQFRTTLGSWAALKVCMASGARATQEARGAFSLAFRIHGSGLVLASKVLGATTRAALEVARCIGRSAKRLRFPAFRSDQPVDLKAKFVL